MDVVIPEGQTFFYPRTVVIAVGDTVRWTNQDGVMSHTATADDGATFDLSLAPSAFSQHTFNASGIFPYHCTPHEALGMRGIVIVGGSNREPRDPDELSVTLGAWSFEGLTVGTETGSVAPTTRTITAGTTLVASAPLPAGALITGIEVAGCDTGGGSLDANLLECIDPPGSAPVGVCHDLATATLIGNVCGFASSAAIDVLADNFGYSYHVEVTMPANTMQLRSVRVFYRKQVPPKPATATFTDVPTNSDYFQFVEALARAGVTTGCGGTNYCPYDAVTRGQLAVLLTRACGLN